MWNVRIVLVEPSGAINLGSVARVMKNMGLNQLWLVNPRCDRLGEEALQMAVHGRELLEQAQVVTDLPQALEDCQRIVATAGRIDPGDRPLVQPTQGLKWAVAAKAAIVFGTEDRGLSNQELQYCQQVINIPTTLEYSSLNLAQAVAICCYHLHLLWLETEEKTQPPVADLASFSAIEGFYQHLETILNQAGYLYPHTSFSRMQKLRQIFDRAELTRAEVAMLRGVCRQLSWKIAQASPPSDPLEYLAGICADFVD
ncbi:MAG: RNA methyltransferase [Pseudanabaenaceae cyanobacterium bins.68]|nr:RNA methyltransferase [Pseudanabaenaceae cyanobacterium bins.68]